MKAPNMIVKLSIITLFSCAICFCGSADKNHFQSFEKEDAAEDATLELEREKPQKAIDILEKELAADGENYQLLSLLSSAYAQKHGIDVIRFAISLASSETKTANPLTALWPALPEATEENVDGVEYAVDILAAIPAEARTNADSFKLGLLSTCLVSLQLKALDLDGDGTLSLEELLRLTSTDAATVFSGLAGAVSALASMSNSLGDNSGAASSQIEDIYQSLQSSSGDSQEEQLTNYLQNNPG